MNLLPRKTNLRILARRPLVWGRRYWLPLSVLLLGALADALTTYRNLREYGAGVEVHLVQRAVSHIFGVAFGVPLAKIIQLGFVILVASYWRPWCPWILMICGILYALAAVSNHFTLI